MFHTGAAEMTAQQEADMLDYWEARVCFLGRRVCELRERERSRRIGGPQVGLHRRAIIRVPTLNDLPNNSTSPSESLNDDGDTELDYSV